MIKAIILVGLMWGANGIEGIPLLPFDTIEACEVVRKDIQINLDKVEKGTALGTACVEFTAEKAE